jgi:CDP-4-dehydro-6-deoxyglucose reductase
MRARMVKGGAVSTITLANGRTFSAAPDVTILEAAHLQGVSLEYSCRTGRCGVCRATVLSGETAVKQFEQPLDRPLAPGQILTCCRAAQSDLVVDIEDLGRLAGIATQTLPCRIEAIERCAADIVHVTLRLPPTATFGYLPGQYVDIIVAGDRRSYSIANAPRADRMIELYVRRYPGGRLSDYWFNRAKTNDLLRFEGPFGTFFLRDGDMGTTIFLATGTGIAPVRALLEEIAASPQPRPGAAWLFWGNREEDSFCWTPGHLGLDLAYVPLLSGRCDTWTGARGWVQDAALQAAPDLADTMVYACGSEQMIASAREAFVARGLPERRFLADAFVSSN